MENNKTNIPFLRLELLHQPLENAFIEVFSECLKKNQFILGPHVTKFEEEFAAFCGTNYAIGVASGLDALKISLLSLGINKGDEVIVPAHTFIATWFAVSDIGAIPVPVDIDEKTMNIDCTLIEDKITNKTKAIIPVHLYGLMVNMDEITALAKKHNLYIVEDFAQAHGSSFNGKKAGSIGHINATSFYPGKNLGALGDAGIITTNDQQLATKARLLRNNGSLEKYMHSEQGYNSRLDNIQAGFLSVKLNHLNNWNNERIQLAEYYKRKLASNLNITFQQTDESKVHTYHLLVIQCEKRDELASYLFQNGVETIIHYPVLPYKQEAYKSMNHLSFPACESAVNKILSLPLYPGLSTQEIDYICYLISHFNEN